MSDGPLVTIACAVFNGAATLARALERVVEQDYTNLEILISDDASTDDSLNICKEFATRDPRIRLLRNETNIGLVDNYNRLIKEANGKYFMWADQDDIRARTFVSKAVAALEADPEAVLCHSQTGVFIGDPTDIKYLITLHGTDNVSSRVLRYHRFLRYFADTVLYGLMRLDALRRTSLCRKDLGFASALLFELLLLGKFIQIPEVLYLYSARGVKKRPDVREEYERSNPGKKLPLFYFPFLVLAMNQTRDIGRADVGALEKLALGSLLWGRTSAVALTKLFYRSLAVPLGDRIPDSITELCEAIVDPKGHLVFLNRADEDEELFPKGWYLKGGA